MTTANIHGEYFLEGQREMASGLLFKPSGQFQFFFSYGALDRYGEGNWKIDGDTLILDSKPRPATDFTLLGSRKTNEPFITITMEKLNPVLQHSIFCSLQQGREGSWEQMNQDGKLQFPLTTPSAISLLLEFCPERFSTIEVNKEHNDFLFRMEPTIMEVFFENFQLKLAERSLTGGHPLLQGDSFNYVKAGAEYTGN